MLDAKLRQEVSPRRVRREEAEADATTDGSERRGKVTGMRQVMPSVGMHRHLRHYP